MSAVENALRTLLGDRLQTGESVRAQHGGGEGHHPPEPPDMVAYARSVEEIQAIVRACAQHRAPIVAFGAGTSLEGQLNAVRGGVALDLTPMNQVLEVNAADLDCLVEPGVTRKQLDAHLRQSGLFFPIDPGADATLGGMVATRASGTNAVRYGTMKENVLGLEVVMADGSLIQTGARAKKSSAGYDLTRLLIGSEGTLGIVTKIRLRLHGRPEAIAAASCAFPSLEAAVTTVSETIQAGVPVARIELLDEVQMKACIAYAKMTDKAAAPTLFYEFHGDEASIEAQVELAMAIAREHGAGEPDWAREPEKRNALWQARHDSYWAASALRPGVRGWATDVCVPISTLAQCVVATKRDLDEAGLLAPIVGHVGDGNFHLLILADREDPDEWARAVAVNRRMVDRAIDLGGTCTGEHGVGLGKQKSLERELAGAVPVMRAIKNALDPLNILNPGKIFAA